MKKIGFTFLSSALFCIAISSIMTQVQGRTLQEEMKLKLLYAQDVLAGLATEDYAQIEKGATGLLNVCEAVGWTEEKTKGQFKIHDLEFHNVAKELLALAVAKNLEGVHYKYIHMTTICMDCHGHVRDVEKAEKYKESHTPHSK